MIKINNRQFFLISLFLVLFLEFINPKWLTLFGLGPSWAVLWLLPWALQNGQLAGLYSGLCIGLLLDGIILEGITQIPVFCFLGFWWGRLGSRTLEFNRIFSLGILAWLGTVIYGMSILCQNYILHSINLFDWGMVNIFSQSILTGLLAPVFCSRMLIFMQQNSSR
tara:strand:+ start:923 stop:1420 length:498 start_codon:yes stop_codon:yes gene_type:complete